MTASPSINGQTRYAGESDPIEPIPHDRFETVEFPARDGFMLNFKRLRPKSGEGEPLLLVPDGPDVARNSRQIAV